MKNSIPFAIMIVCFLFACRQNTSSNRGRMTSPPASSSPEISIKTLTINGLYQSNDKLQLLRDCESGKTFWVEKNALLDSLRQTQLLMPSYELEPVFVRLTGELNTNPTGEGSNYDGFFGVKKIESVETLNSSNCCEAYEFWCGGSEPFWNCQIFPPDGFIIFREASGERAYLFPGVKPTVSGKTYTYVSKNEAGESIKIIIKEEKASDGMSEIVYNYSSKIELGKQKYAGTALKFGEKLDAAGD